MVELARDWQPQRVYNFEVETDHVYYVGGFEVLTHNGCKNQASIDKGNAKHDEFYANMQADGYKTDQRIGGESLLRPDALKIIYDVAGNAIGAEIHELKPNNDRAIKRWNSQLAKYAREVSRIFGIALESITTKLHKYD